MALDIPFGGMAIKPDRMSKRAGFGLICRMRYPWIFSIILVLGSSCSSKYHAFESNYRFRSPDGKPDYGQLDYWAAHPWKWDPSDSIPLPFIAEQRDSLADVFFLHPTTYTKKRKGPNAAIDDTYINAKTDYSSILYQASVFNNSARIFAPRYRQAHIKTFFEKDKTKAAQAFDLAYEDLKTAFSRYLQHWNKGRPIVIAAHSQGSMLAERLLKEFFEDKPLRRQLVAAYLLGWPVSKEYFSTLSLCADSLQTGCLCSWRTLRKGFIPGYMKEEKGNAWVTNPLTWTTGNEYAPKELNRGSVLVQFNRIYLQTTGAQAKEGLLFVRKPKFPGSFFYFTRNYHIADINLFYRNIRDNAALRIHRFLQHAPKE